MKYSLLCFSIFIWLLSCTSSNETDQKEGKAKKKQPEFVLNPAHSAYKVEMIGLNDSIFSQHYESRIPPPTLNLNQSLVDLSISDLLLLKNTLLAMKGQVFSDALFHAYFDSIPWYQPPFWLNEFSIELNSAEQQFVDRIDLQINEIKEGYMTDEAFNIKYAANLFRHKDLTNQSKLNTNGFYLDFSDHNQLHDIYLQNQQDIIPSFITTDLIMHHMHLFYGMLENEIEEVHLTAKLRSMLEIINKELYSSYEKTLDPKVEKAIEENLLYYAIPYGIITGKKTNLIGSYSELYVAELTKVLRSNGKGSAILKDPGFDFSIFTPHQQYSKNDHIKKYFKALTWLQEIKLCLNDEDDFNKALIVAYIIHKSGNLKSEYRGFIELKTYFSSQKPQFTLWDLADEIGKISSIKLFEDIFREENQGQIRASLNINNQEDCELTVSLIPIEHQNLFTDLNRISGKKTGATTIDIFSSLNNLAAKELYNDSQSNENDASQTLIKKNLAEISSQEDAISMDWLSTLLISFNSNTPGHAFMSQQPWKRKELSSALSSWIQLNQRVNLKAQGINTSEIEQSGKVLPGYVEPNRNFWESSLTLLNNTETYFSAHNMLSKKSKRNLDKLANIVKFLDEVSKKQLSDIQLNNDEYNRINSIGSELHDLSLKMINPNYNIKHQKITSSTLYATTVYRSQNGNIIGGIGHPAYLYTVVEIDKLLYLTRGAVFTYYEIPDYNRQSISQDTWEKVISDNLQPVEWATSLYHNGMCDNDPIVAQGN